MMKRNQLRQKPLQQLQLQSQLQKLNKNKKMLKKTKELLQRKVKNLIKINFSNLTSKLTQSDNDQGEIYFVFKKKIDK
jgi:response regulator of citrate/malate metabolism